MTRFRPCIDLHGGVVKQIVGGTLSEDEANLRTNFVSAKPSSWFARRYREDGVKGGHVIMLGPGNEEAAREALGAWSGGLQVGGGITPGTAAAWLEAGASHVIVTSALFDKHGAFLPDALETMVREVGRDHLVIDLSCRRDEDGWVVAMNRWQTPTSLRVTTETMDSLSSSCAEFLIHAADCEGLCQGVDEDLVRVLGAWGGAPITYAGGARSLDDLHRVQELSAGKVDVTIGSALDMFGGDGVCYGDCVQFNRRGDV